MSGKLRSYSLSAGALYALLTAQRNVRKSVAMAAWEDLQGGVGLIHLSEGQPHYHTVWEPRAHCTLVSVV